MQTTGPSRNLANTALLGAAVFLVPVLLGLLFLQIYQRLAAPRAPEPPGSAALTNRLTDATVTDCGALLALRDEARTCGLPTDEIDLRLWAAQSSAPAELFRVRPPADGEDWRWSLSHDGLYAVAAAQPADAAGRRRAGLYDLVAGEWVWTNALPWPESHERPYVFDRHLVLRYAKNASRFALEVGPDGRILALDALGRASAAWAAPAAPPPQAGFPGAPVAVKGGVFFAADPDSRDLVGYACERLPALRQAGSGDENTLFSGDGRLQFTIRGGAVTVRDSLTQTVLQRLDAWKPATNITVTGALTTRDGSSLSVFLRADFGGTPAVTREWSVSVATYTGAVLPSFNADALLAKPRRVSQTQAVSRDGRWLLSVSADNTLTVAAAADRRVVARASLAGALGAARPVEHLAVLEGGRHVVLRQRGGAFWLLDFEAARGYAGLLARLQAATSAAAAKAGSAPEERLPPSAVETALGEDPFLTPEPWPELPPPGPFALRAERCAAHQAWPYAAALLDVCATYSSFDGRAPRVNPLLQARAEILAGRRDKARAVCRRALCELVADPSGYNRMIRYQLQGLYFAQP